MINRILKKGSGRVKSEGLNDTQLGHKGDPTYVLGTPRMQDTRLTHVRGHEGAEERETPRDLRRRHNGAGEEDTTG